MNNSSPWSPWGVRLVAVLSVGLVLSLGWEWTEVFYRGVAVNAQLSYFSFDVPGPGGHLIGATRIIGNHYFGDFQLPLFYAKDLLQHGVSPYTGQVPPDNYPPLSQILFIPFTYPPLRVAAVLYLVLSATIFLVPLWLLLAPLRPAYRVIFLAPVAVLTAPFAAVLDRGNDIGIALGVIFWALWAWRRDRFILCGIFLVVAISLKAYPATLLVVPIALRRYRFTAIVVSSTMFVNAVALAALPGGFFGNLRALNSALKSSSSVAYLQLASWSIYSIVPKTAGLFWGMSTQHSLLDPKSLVIWLPSIAYLVGVYLIIRIGKVPQWCWGPLALATTQLFVPLSFVYTAGWASAAAVWFAWGSLVEVRRPLDVENGSTGNWVLLRVMVLSSLAATLIPSVFTVSGVEGFQTPLTRYLSPVLILLTLCVALVVSFRKVDKRSTKAIRRPPIGSHDISQFEAGERVHPEASEETTC
jgi:hypothetical protein